MLRALLVWAGAVLLSFFLLTAFTIGWVCFTRSGRKMSDVQIVSEEPEAIRQKHGDPFERMAEGRNWFAFVFLPATSILTGIAVGLFQKDRPGLVALLALIPVHTVYLVAYEFGLVKMLLAGLYLTLGYLAASAVRDFRLRRGLSN